MYSNHSVGLGADESQSWLSSVGQSFNNLLQVGAVSYLTLQQQKNQLKAQENAYKLTQAQMGANYTAAQKYSMMESLVQSQNLVPIVLGVGGLGILYMYMRRRRG